MKDFLKLMSRYIGYPFPYILFVFLALMVLYSIAPNWRMFIDTFFNKKIVYFVFIVFGISYVYSRSEFLKKLFLAPIFRYFVILSILLYSIIHGIYFADFLILFYALFLILFSGRKFLPFRKLLFTISIPDGRIPASFALFFLILTPVFLILNLEELAEQFAVYAYYFLVITVVTQIIEMKANWKRERLPMLFKEEIKIWKNLIIETTRKLRFRHLLKIGIFLGILVLIYAGKFLYTRKVLHLMESKEAFRSKISILNQERKEYVLTSRMSELSIPIVVEHPISKPFIWNGVSIRILWFEKQEGENNRTHRQSVWQEKLEFEGEPMVIRESERVDLKLKKGFLPEGEYEVWITLAQMESEEQEEIWFYKKGDSVLKINVRVKFRFDETNKVLDKKILTEQKKLEEEWNSELKTNMGSYRSKINFFGNIYKDHNLTFQLQNKSNTPWPIHNETPVMLGLLFVKKKDDGSNFIQDTACFEVPVHVYPEEIVEIHKSIHDVLRCPLPGRNEVYFKCLQKNSSKEESSKDCNQQKYQSMSPKEFYRILFLDYDEIWVSLLHAEIIWFYQKGDDVLNIKSLSEEDKAKILISNNKAITKDRINLAKERAIRLKKMSDDLQSKPENYRSEIKPFINQEILSQLSFSTGNGLEMELEIANKGNVSFPIETDNSVKLGFRWISIDKGNALIKEELFPLPTVLGVGEELITSVQIGKKLPPGKYQLWVSLYHENVGWFFEKGDTPYKITVSAHQ